MKNIEEIGFFEPREDADHNRWFELSDFVTTGRVTGSDVFGRDPAVGHVTGSAFVVSSDHRSVLLTLHAKLDMWLQLGGHCDGIADVPFVALKEAYEESGLRRIQAFGDPRQVLDVDIQTIPANLKDQEHLHYDVRYLFVASDLEFKISAESKSLRWVPLADLEDYNASDSLLRLRSRAQAVLR